MIPINTLPIVAFLAAFLAALWLHPKMVRVAKLKNIVDNPNKRKLHRKPVPVLGGLVVFFGMVLGVGITTPCYHSPDTMFLFTMILLVLYIGTMDDILGLTPRIRFIFEILVSLAMIYIGGMSISHFHGLWGIGNLTPWVGVPLTVLTVVGIINAINLIDGVNGLCSGYCIMACTAFGLYFSLLGDTTMTILAAACIGTLILFFYHNVFGHTLRMFMGDGGSLMMGFILSAFVLRVLTTGPTPHTPGLGLVPFVLAVLAIPVFDTLRVMGMRMLRRRSPFSPDKTHLHHLFIDLGFSHLATTLTIIALNNIIIAVQISLYYTGQPVDIQFYSVIALGTLFTIGPKLLFRHRVVS